MDERPRLDHVVVNVRFEMDRAASLFSSLGFHLTPRGHHTLGSINHLMVFDTSYLELIGLPRGAGPVRLEIAEAPLGLNGLVVKTEDADRTFAHLAAIGMAGEPPRAFSRPVAFADGTEDARFRTVAVRPGVFAAGRVFFCEHRTPGLVWRPEWQRHPNGSGAILGCIVVSASPAREAERYAALLGVGPGGTGEDELWLYLGASRLSFLSPARYRERYGPLASAMEGRDSIFGAVLCRCADVARAGEHIARHGIGCESRRDGERLIVRIRELDTLLELTE
jgi:hypothetical protein